MRVALGISYNGQAYQGWQSQTSGLTIQDKLEKALGKFAAQRVSTLCAGRTDSGVHGIMQVVHFDTGLERDMHSWVRGTNANPIRPSVDHGRVGWAFRSLDGHAMQQAADLLLGEHDFSSFRASQCQALTPVKHLMEISMSKRGAYWRIEFEANAFLHHMIRNIMGDVLLASDRRVAAPTFSPDGLYFLGPRYDPKWGLPDRNAAYDGLP